MKNIIYLDSDFNFLLLENEEIESGIAKTRIFINIKTSAETNQRFEISVAGGAIVTENIASNTLVEFELTQDFWADNNTVEITPKNNSVTGDTITLNFPPLFSTSGGLNYVSDTEFDVKAQNEDFAEGGSGSGGGSGSASGGFDFVEIIRNIGFRLLDEPSNVNIFYDDVNQEVSIKWTDPNDITSNEPAPAEWAGTVVVRKDGSAPLHKWDGDLIVDSTTRDDYASTALLDNTITEGHSYYYGIFPYDTKGDYRYTKVVVVSTEVTTVTDFDYTGSIQTFTVPKDGIYQLEVWGAQGGTATDDDLSANGGYGSYSTGEVELHQGDTLYIGVGGQGGYNGGGTGS